jgi:hypothetical protein
MSLGVVPHGSTHSTKLIMLLTLINYNKTPLIRQPLRVAASNATRRRYLSTACLACPWPSAPFLSKPVPLLASSRWSPRCAAPSPQLTHHPRPPHPRMRGRTHSRLRHPPSPPLRHRPAPTRQCTQMCTLSGGGEVVRPPTPAELSRRQRP